MLSKKSKLFLALFWTLIVAFLSTAELGDVGSKVNIPFKDKYVHFVFYFVFVALWYYYLKARDNFNNIDVVVLIGAILFGIGMEVFQATLTSSRQADSIDVLANTVGAISGLCFVKYLLKK